MKVQIEKPVQTRSRARGWLWILGAVVAIIILSGAALAALPILVPAASASAADALRAVLGPQPVAELESAAFRVQDIFNRFRYQLSGGQPQITWANPGVNPGQSPSAPSSAAAAAVPEAPKQNNSPVPSKPSTQATHVSLPGVVDAPPAIGWQAFGSSLSSVPVMARASVNPDPSRPYAQVALVRIDLSQIQLHMVPGTVEPVAAKGTPSFPRPGVIPADVQSSGDLLAAFNGGFKAIHGGYGMMVNGVTILPPKDGMATLAIYRDGSIRIGAWGRDITATPNLAAYRQNCPLLLDAGQINPSVNDESRKEWGYTVQNLDTTWRSGLGISRDGRFLIYAVGNSLTVESLARALQEGGAYYAMQLDINGFYTRFVTFQPSNSQPGAPVVADKLLSQMTAKPTQFLVPYDRDFFYVTVISSGKGESLHNIVP